MSAEVLSSSSEDPGAPPPPTAPRGMTMAIDVDATRAELTEDEMLPRAQGAEPPPQSGAAAEAPPQASAATAAASRAGDIAQPAVSMASDTSLGGAVATGGEEAAASSSGNSPSGGGSGKSAGGAAAEGAFQALGEGADAIVGEGTDAASLGVAASSGLDGGGGPKSFDMLVENAEREHQKKLDEAAAEEEATKARGGVRRPAGGKQWPTVAQESKLEAEKDKLGSGIKREHVTSRTEADHRARLADAKMRENKLNRESELATGGQRSPSEARRCPPPLDRSAARC
jgi:hypothetical protein